MAYAKLTTIQTLNVGDVLTAACLVQADDNFEFLIDPPACSVYRTTAQTVADGATLVAITANAENYDNDSMHSTSVNTSRITAQTAGRYRMSGVVLFAANSTGSRDFVFRVNGTTDYQIELDAAVTGTHSRVMSGSRTLILAAGDYVELMVWQTSGGNLGVTLDEFSALFLTR